MITLSQEVGATISAVKIRAVTLGLDLPMPEVRQQPFAEAGRFLANARNALESGGIEVQRLRLAGGVLDPSSVAWSTSPRDWAAHAEAAARGCGIEDVSLGRLPPTAHAFVAQELAPILAAGENVFVRSEE